MARSGSAVQAVMIARVELVRAASPASPTTPLPLCASGVRPTVFLAPAQPHKLALTVLWDLTFLMQPAFPATATA
jgi:hypothetical protein